MGKGLQLENHPFHPFEFADGRTILAFAAGAFGNFQRAFHAHGFACETGGFRGIAGDVRHDRGMTNVDQFPFERFDFPLHNQFSFAPWPPL